MSRTGLWVGNGLLCMVRPYKGAEQECCRFCRRQRTQRELSLAARTVTGSIIVTVIGMCNVLVVANLRHLAH